MPGQAGPWSSAGAANAGLAAMSRRPFLAELLVVQSVRPPSGNLDA